MIAGWTYLAFTTAYIPFVAFRGAKRFHALKEPPDKPAMFRSVIITQVIFGLFAALIAQVENVELFPKPDFEWTDLVYALAFLVPTLATIPIRWNWRSNDEKQRTMRSMPGTARDVPLWTLLSLGAGVTEEMVYRGVMFQLWLVLLGSWWLAALVCSVAFCLAHAVQGWRSMAVIFPMAIANHLIVLATGDLYTMMAVHFVYDVLAGLFFLYLARKDGIEPEVATTT